VVLTLSDVQLDAERSEHVRPGSGSSLRSRCHGGDVGRRGYHYWRVIHILQAPTMLDAAKILIDMAAKARDAAGLGPAQAVRLSCLFRDLSHPVDLALPPEGSAPDAG
jgi:hypothetical protein